MKNKSSDEAIYQPDNLQDLKVVVSEFINKIQAVDNEIEMLKGDRKDIIEEYKEKLDMKTLQAALKVIKITKGVEHKSTFDSFMEVLEGID